MSTTQEIFVAVLDEGVDVFRPVQGSRLSEDLFRIESPRMDQDEVWRFATGSVVRCEVRQFADGRSGLLAVELVESVPHSFWAEAEDLWVADGARLVWRGRPDGAPVLAAVALPGTDDAVALLDAAAGPRDPRGDLEGWPNLVRVGSTGEVVWRAPAVESRDWWVTVAWRDGRLVAHTWSSFAVELDPRTGREISRNFTK